MFRYLPIRRIYAREVLDSRGNPTVEVDVTVGEGVMGIDGYTGRALVAFRSLHRTVLRRWNCGTAKNGTAVWACSGPWIMSTEG